MNSYIKDEQDEQDEQLYKDEQMNRMNSYIKDEQDEQLY